MQFKETKDLTEDKLFSESDIDEMLNGSKQIASLADDEEEVNYERIVKIGDFGLARDIYKSDYYRKEGLISSIQIHNNRIYVYI